MTTELTEHPTTARSRILAPTATLAGIALLLSGCGNGGGDEAASASDQDSQATEQTPTESVYQFDQARVDRRSCRRMWLTRVAGSPAWR